jgi:hypothetical protein
MVRRLGWLAAGVAAAVAISFGGLALGSSRPVHKHRMQLGIDVDFYHWRAEDVRVRAAETIGYAKRLHANAIIISFPFFMHGQSSTTVHRTVSTPSATKLSIIVLDARQAGMRVLLRPLLASASLGRSRTGWRPVNQAAWFRSYERFLRPYLAMAQRDGVAEFIEGSEFPQFDTAPGWHSLDKWARRVYHRTLACAANWSKVPAVICGGVAEMVDAYPPVPDGTLLAGWERYDRTLRRGTGLAEVGIAAAAEARTNPDRYGWPVRHPDPTAQAQWFAAACHAAEHAHLGSIYFWPASLGPQVHGPTLHYQMSWGHSRAARAIAACFASIERAGR